MRRTKRQAKDLREKIIKLRGSDFSYPEIARTLGLKSHQLVQYYVKGQNSISRFYELKEKSNCYFCGEDNIKTLKVHHIDRNRKNNKPRNLIVFCGSCHGKLHKTIYPTLSTVDPLQRTKQIK